MRQGNQKKNQSTDICSPNTASDLLLWWLQVTAMAAG